MRRLLQLAPLVAWVLCHGCATTTAKVPSAASNPSAPAAPPPSENSGPARTQAIAEAIETKIVPAVQIRGEEQYATLESRMKALKVPAVSIAVFEDHALVWAKSYGVIETGQSREVGPQTRFQAASISKPVHALAVLKIAQARGLDLNAPVNRYLKSWKIPQHAWSDQHPVTLRQLLSHTGGTTVHGFSGYPTGTSLP